MKSSRPSFRWGVEQRLEFIEFRLYWDGSINRSDIRGFFGVSVPQASKDFSRYQELAPGNIYYDKSGKRYLPAESFSPVLLKPDATQYLTQLKSIDKNLLDPEDFWGAQIPSFNVLPMPNRHIEPEALRTVLDVIRNEKAVEIRYQSLSLERPKPMWRWITPHAFAFDGLRWHVRAFCHNSEKHKDFLLSRILDTKNQDRAAAKAEDDLNWQETTTVILKPHPGLTKEQQSVVARDFGMKSGTVKIDVRLALLYYLLRRLGVDFKEHKRDPREQHIVLANPQEVREACDRANIKTSMW